MITVRRFSGEELVINAELIEMIESTPDTVITLVTGKKILVREDADEVVARVIAYRHAAYGQPDGTAPPALLPPTVGDEGHSRSDPGVKSRGEVTG